MPRPLEDGLGEQGEGEHLADPQAAKRHKRKQRIAELV
jgi:hypothetical protein